MHLVTISASTDLTVEFMSALGALAMSTAAVIFRHPLNLHVLPLGGPRRGNAPTLTVVAPVAGPEMGSMSQNSTPSWYM